MLILRFVNVGNSRISARDSIVILTLIAWAAISISVLKVFSYDLHLRRGMQTHASFCITLLSGVSGGYI